MCRSGRMRGIRSMPVADAGRSAHIVWILTALLSVAGLCPCAAAIADDSTAVILLYHHIDTTTPRSTSITPASFEAQLDYLEREGYSVLPLAEIVRALRAGERLPPRTVALTFDDGYSSVYGEALPRLERRDWPFTVFVATDYIDDGYAGFMTWAELRDLEGRGGTVANHSTSHAHLIRRQANEREADWRARVGADIEAAQARLDAELDHPLRMFAYPYGEFDSALETIVAELGLVAFGQQSGPVGTSSGMQQLARFPMATGYDSLESFAEKLRTLPLPVTVLAPASRVLGARSAAPTLEVRLSEGGYRRDALRCYVAGQDPARLDWQDDVVRIRAQRPLGPGRSKYNCTAPSATTSGVYYWYSHLWIQPRDDGSWYPD